MMTGTFVVVPAVVVDVTAKGMAFDIRTITVPAGAYVTVHFTNSDSGIPHNVAFYDSSRAQTVLFQGAVITGRETIDYTFFAPETPGTYFFRCDVHPALMTGGLRRHIVRGSLALLGHAMFGIIPGLLRFRSWHSTRRVV